MPLLAIAVLLLNDHWLKYSYPGVATGKISDVAGMVFFPLMLQALVELVDRREPFRPSRGLLGLCAMATGLVFGATNLFHWAAEAYREGLGLLQWPFLAGLAWVRQGVLPSVQPVHLTADPTDVIAVPFVLIAVWAGWRRTSR